MPGNLDLILWSIWCEQNLKLMARQAVVLEPLKRFDHDSESLPSVYYWMHCKTVHFAVYQIVADIGIEIADLIRLVMRMLCLEIVIHHRLK